MTILSFLESYETEGHDVMLSPIVSAFGNRVIFVEVSFNKKTTIVAILLGLSIMSMKNLGTLPGFQKKIGGNFIVDHPLLKSTTLVIIMMKSVFLKCWKTSPTEFSPNCTNKFNSLARY